MTSCASAIVLQVVCVCWFLLDLCWKVVAEEFCVQDCTCTNIQDTTPPIWPEVVAATAGAVAPVVVGGVGYGVKKLLSPKANASGNDPLIRDYNREDSLTDSLSSDGYNNRKRPRSALSVLDNEDEDVPFDEDFSSKSSASLVGGQDGSTWASTPRGPPMARPSFLPSQSVAPAVSGRGLNSWM